MSPQTVLERHMCDASIIGVIFDGVGEVLWHGRKHRYATPAQVSALIARDKGCVICPRGPVGAHAHHLIPYNAPLKGETNIDGLVLVCDSCHNYIHTNNLTLYKNESGVWKTRLATPEETPPARPEQSKQRPPKAGQKPRTNGSTDPPPEGRAPPDRNGDPAPETQQPPPSKPTFTFRCEVGRAPPLW